MRLITVLNQCTKFKRFVFEESRLDEDGRILVSLRSRKNSRGECSGCGQLSPTYDTATDARRFEFVPVWGFSVFLVYRMRRVACNACAGWLSRRSPGVRASITSPTYTGAFWRSGRRSCRGRRWPAPSGPAGTKYTIRSSMSWNMSSLIAASTRSPPSAWMKSSIVKRVVA